MTKAMERERERLRLEREQAKEAEKSKGSMSPTKASVSHILEKARRDRQSESVEVSQDRMERAQMAAQAAARRRVMENSHGNNDDSSEVDQLEPTQNSSPGRVRGGLYSETEMLSAPAIQSRSSPTTSESELATSPLLMADEQKNESNSQINRDVKEVALPPPVETAKEARERGNGKSDDGGSDGSSDTSDDSDDSDDSDSDSDDDDKSSSKASQSKRGKDQEEESEDDDDEIEEEKSADSSMAGNKDESSSSSISTSDQEEEQEEGGGETGTEEDQIESTPIPAKATVRSRWISGLSSLVGLGGSQEKGPTASPIPEVTNSSQEPPTSAQKPRVAPLSTSSSTPIQSPANGHHQRPRPNLGGARLSQLDTSALKKSFSQPGTPRSGADNPSSPFVTPSLPMKRKRDEKEKVVLESDSDSQSDDDEEEDSEDENTTTTLPTNKRAGQQKKPRSSLLAQFGKY